MRQHAPSRWRRCNSGRTRRCMARHSRAGLLPAKRPMCGKWLIWPAFGSGGANAVLETVGTLDGPRAEEVVRDAGVSVIVDAAVGGIRALVGDAACGGASRLLELAVTNKQPYAWRLESRFRRWRTFRWPIRS